MAVSYTLKCNYFQTVRYLTKFTKNMNGGRVIFFFSLKQVLNLMK